MSWDDSITMIALVSVPLLIVASFIVDLAAGNRYMQRIDRWNPDYRAEQESTTSPRLSAERHDGPEPGRFHRCPYSGVDLGSPRSGAVRVSSRGRVCRQHRD
jgi:hypothetical protein